MRAALLLALAALPPARASAATCHTYTPAEQADATLMCAAAVDYEFAVPAGFHPDEAARALVGGDDAAVRRPLEIEHRREAAPPAAAGNLGGGRADRGREASEHEAGREHVRHE